MEVRGGTAGGGSRVSAVPVRWRSCLGRKVKVSVKRCRAARVACGRLRGDPACLRVRNIDSSVLNFTRKKRGQGQNKADTIIPATCNS